MANLAHRKIVLTDKIIESAEPPDEGFYYLTDARKPGLVVRVMASGTKAFPVRDRNKAGTERYYRIGKAPDWKIRAARIQASDIKAQVRSGHDPLDERRAEQAALTIGGLCDLFIAKHLPTLSPSPAADYRSIIKRCVRPKFGKWKVSELSRSDLRKPLIEIDDKFPTRAGAVMRVSGSMYNTAHDKEWIPDRVVNPTAGIKLPKLVARDHVLADRELVAIWNATDALGHPVGPIVKLLILTGQRREDVSGMRWAEIDFDQRVWNIPGSCTKNKHAHVFRLKRWRSSPPCPILPTQPSSSVLLAMSLPLPASPARKPTWTN